MTSTSHLPDAWRRRIAELRPQQPTPAQWRQAWQTTLAAWSESDQGPRPMWWPDEDARDHSGIARAACLAGFAGDPIEAFYEWSIAEPAAFWGAMVNELGIHFATPPAATLDLSMGVETPHWFPGGQLSIVESCFAADAKDIAILHSHPDGSLEPITYGSLRRQVNRVVASLRAAGIEAGQSLAIMMPMTAEAVAIFLGIIAAGCAAVSIADSFAAAEIEKRLRISAATLIFCGGTTERAGKSIDIYRRVRDAAAPTAIVVGGQNQPQRPGDASYEQFLAGAVRASVDDGGWHVTAPDQTTGILFSSGTTGDPKAIPWDQTTPIKAAIDGRLLQDIRPGDVVVWPTNLGWMMGPWLIYASLINRATIGLYHDAPSGEPFGQFVEKAGVTMLGVVPTLVRGWRKSRAMETCDWGSIRCFSSTGEASDADDMFYLSSLAGMRPVIEYCGGTEIGGGYIASSLLHPNVPGAFATPAFGSRLTILDEQYQPADNGTLYLIPPALGLSTRLLHRDHHETYYAGTPSGPQGEILRRHGDHFRRLPGEFYVAGGRVDDTMNLGGIKVSSAEIEAAIGQPAGVQELAAISVGDPSGGPARLVIFATPAADAEPTVEALRREMTRRIREQLNPLFKIAEVLLIDRLPRTASNKVMRRELRDDYQQLKQPQAVDD